MNEKQARFAEEYIIDLNATQAAVRAGYSARTAGVVGHKLLKNAEIQEAIQRAQRARSARTGITADRVLLEIGRIAFADPRSVMQWGPGGVELIESRHLTDDQAAIVSEVSEIRNENGGSVKIKLWSKTDALEKLARHVGLYDAERNTTVVVEEIRRTVVDPKVDDVEDD